jgi:hypothetical protein
MKARSKLQNIIEMPRYRLTKVLRPIWHFVIIVTIVKIIILSGIKACSLLKFHAIYCIITKHKIQIIIMSLMILISGLYHK